MKTTNLMISASMNTDDYSYEVSFNAEPYFWEILKDKGEEGILKEFKLLLEDDFGSGYNTDDIALFFQNYEGSIPEYSSIRAAFEHNSELPESVEARGFSCQIEEKDLMKWMEQNTPSVFNSAKEYRKTN